MAEQALARFGRVDILVNNAGIEGATKITTEMTPAEWQEVIDIDLTGTWLATRAVLPAMKQQKSGGNHKYLVRTGPARLPVPGAVLRPPNGE